MPYWTKTIVLAGGGLLLAGVAAVGVGTAAWRRVHARPHRGYRQHCGPGGHAGARAERARTLEIRFHCCLGGAVC